MDLSRIKTSRTNPLLVEEVAADKVRQFLDIYDKTNHPSVSNLTVHRIRASFTKRGIRLRYGSNAIVVRALRLSHLGLNKARGDLPVGIGLSADVQDVLLVRGVIENLHTQLADQKHYCINNCNSNNHRVQH